MNDIVLNGETLEISRVVDSIEIEGFDHTFADGKVESKLVVAPGGSEPGPEPTNQIEIIGNNDPKVLIQLPNINQNIDIIPIGMAENFIVDQDYKTAYNSLSSITTKTFTNTVKAGDIILLCVAHRAAITVPSDFTFIKKLTESGNPQYNSVYIYEVQNDIENYTVTITQSSSQRLNYYIAITRGCNVINNTSIDRGGNNGTSYTMNSNVDFSNFIIFYSCVYSGGNPQMPNNTFKKYDLDTANEHRMVIFIGYVAECGEQATISGMGEGNIIAGIKLERRL